MLVKKLNLLKDGRIQLLYSKPCGDFTMDTSIKCPEKASPEFYLAIEKLVPFALKILQLPKDSRISIRGVIFTYVGEDFVMGARCHLKMRLSTDEFVDIVTPFRYASHATDTITDSQLFGNELEEVFVEIAEECKLYINGKREQTQLPLEN